MTRAGEYSFTGHDLQTFHQSPLQIFDVRRSLPLPKGSAQVFGFGVAINHPLDGYRLTNTRVYPRQRTCDGLDVIVSPRVGGLTSRKEVFTPPAHLSIDTV